MPQRSPQPLAGFVGALDVEVVRPGETGGGTLLGLRVLRIVDGERAEHRLAVLHPTAEHVDVAHEADDERRRRMVEDLLWRSDLLDVALVHHHHPIGDFERFFLVVSDEDAGEADLVVQPSQPAAQLLPDLGVERAERLVEEQDARFSMAGARANASSALADEATGGRASGLSFGDDMGFFFTVHRCVAETMPGRSASACAEARPLHCRSDGAMVKRAAKMGANVGTTFWGCSTYPQCGGVPAVEW